TLRRRHNISICIDEPEGKGQGLGLGFVDTGNQACLAHPSDGSLQDWITRPLDQPSDGVVDSGYARSFRFTG
ncbi:hypothetical protein, partial [Gracilimonas halophila]